VSRFLARRTGKGNGGLYEPYLRPAPVVVSALDRKPVMDDKVAATFGLFH